jgi:DNA-binding XRE family transcriptional regulator
VLHTTAFAFAICVPSAYLGVMSDLSQRVAGKIKSKRKELGITQQELAAILGCTYQLVQHYESGFCQMPIYMLNDFAILCRVPIDWFFLDEHSMLVYVGMYT